MAENAGNAQGVLTKEFTPAAQASVVGSLLTTLKARNGELAPYKHKAGATPFAPTEALSLDDFLNPGPSAPNGKYNTKPAHKGRPIAPTPRQLQHSPGTIDSVEEYADALLHGRAPPGHLTTQIDMMTHKESNVAVSEAAAGKPAPDVQQQPDGSNLQIADNRARDKARPQGQPAKKRKLMVDDAALKKFSCIESALAKVFCAED